jgi:hypothetical protein
VNLNHKLIVAMNRCFYCGRFRPDPTKYCGTRVQRAIRALEMGFPALPRESSDA